MVHLVLVPKVGLRARSARIRSWVVAPGAMVQEGQPLALAESDETSVQIASPATGYLRQILAEAGTEVAVGKPVAFITSSSDEPLLTVVESPQPDLAGSCPGGLAGNGAGATRTSGAMRAAVARSVSESWSIPQIWVERTVELAVARHSLQEYLRTTGQEDVSLLDVILFACVRAAAGHTWLTLLKDVHLGYTVAGGSGVVKPVIRAAQSMTIGELARTRRAAVGRAKADKLLANELSGATFSISNLGPFGADRSMALVSPGQSAALAIGRLQSRLKLGEHGGAEEVPVVSLVLTVDQRTVDGAKAAEYLDDVASMLEHPLGLE